MPYALGVVDLLIVVFFATHVLRTGRPWYWIMIMTMAPFLGSLIYFISEYLPEMRYSRGGRKVLRAVEAAVDPNRAMREAETEFERSPTAANRAALAAALSAAGSYDEAIKHYDECASGSYAKDVHFVRSLAATNLLAERWSAARASYERLFALGKDARQPDDDLGYAFALARLGDGSADAAFQHAVTTANGPVARCRYALYLDESGRRREARELYEQVVKEGRLAPAHTQDLHKAWYRLAADALKAP